MFLKRGKSVLASLGLGLCLVGAYAQQPTPAVDVAYHVEYGQYLIGTKGRSLYAFTSDSAGQSSCYDQCAELWPPVLVQDETPAATQLGARLLGTSERKDGTSQLTFGGQPLYYFAKDRAIGDFGGQGVQNVWFLVSRQGELVRSNMANQEADEQADGDTRAAAPAANAGIAAELLAEGEAIFTTTTSPSCATCHGAAGEGGAGAALADNAGLSDTELVLRQIIQGGHTMPAFGSQLSDREVAAVATFIRNSWGNDFGVVTPEDSNAAR